MSGPLTCPLRSPFDTTQGLTEPFDDESYASATGCRAGATAHDSIASTHARILDCPISLAAEAQTNGAEHGERGDDFSRFSILRKLLRSLFYLILNGVMLLRVGLLGGDVDGAEQACGKAFAICLAGQTLFSRGLAWAWWSL